MKVSGKTALLTIILSVASLLGGNYVKCSPTLFEPKFEQSSPEADAELKIGEKKEIHFAQFIDSDDDYIGTPLFGNNASIAFLFNGNGALRIQTHSLLHIPRYLLYCSFKINFC